MPNFLLHYQQTNPDHFPVTDGGSPSTIRSRRYLVKPSGHDEGDRFNQPNLLYVADDFAHRIATGNGFMGALNSQPAGWDAAVPAFLWRSTTPASFKGWPTTAYGSSSNLAVIRSDQSYTPNLVIGFKGQSADAAINGHRHYDAGSFVMQDRSQAMFIDPGYFQPNSPQHSTPTVDGFAPSTANAAYIAKVDPTSIVDTSVKKSVTMVLTGAYPGGVSRARRTLTAYQDKAFVVLDDLVPTGPGITMGSFQTGFPTTTNSGAFTIKGSTTSMTCTPYGPQVSMKVVGPQAFSQSWVFANSGVQWYTVNLNYTSTAANPLATVCIDSSSGLTAKVTNSGGMITISFSDGTTLTYAAVAGGWQLQ